MKCALSGLVSLTASTQPAPPVDLASPRPAALDPLPRVREGEGRFAFSKLVLTGGKLDRHPERAGGPLNGFVTPRETVASFTQWRE